jgi:hypothetical protein
MPRMPKVALAALAAALAAPAPAGAAIDPSKALVVPSGSAEAMVLSLNEVPLHFHSSALQAMHAAERTPTMQSLHRRMHPLEVTPYVWRARNPYWYVVFTYRGRIVATANVSRAGKVTGVWTGKQAIAPYAHGGMATILTTPWMLAPFSLLFMLVFFDPRRLRVLTVLDGLAVLAFLISYLLLAGAHLEPSVWLAYPPLAYLLARLVWLGCGRGRRPGRIAPLLSQPVLIGGLVVMLTVRIVLSVIGHQEIDVGYESVIGAFRALHHLPLYYNDPNHGDTYGPVTYLAYVPFELLFPWRNSLSSLHAADAAAIVWDLGTVLALIALGRRLRPGEQGRRLGLVLAWAWTACPFTTIALIVHTNDVLVAMLTVLALVALRSPAASGALLGAAAAAKFSPAGLLPLLASPRRRGVGGALRCAGAFVAVVGVAIFAWLPPGGLGYFWRRTIGFQINRPDVFSPWTLHPSLHPLQTALEVLAIVLLVAVALYPRERSLAQVCALAGAVTIAVQLPATHWFYYYIVWFLPFALVGVLVAPHALDEREAQAAKIGQATIEPALAGA